MSATQSITDLYFSNNRVIFLSGDINDKSSKEIIAKLLAYDWNDSSQDILLLIDSPGGSV